MSETKRRVLLVDDERDLVKTVGKYLEVAGFEVLVARDGEEALTMVRTGPTVDVMILDLMLPKRSGLEVCEALRKDERFRQAPIIILHTGKGEEMDEKRLREWGADAYLSKTEGATALIEQINILLGKSRGA